MDNRHKVQARRFLFSLFQHKANTGFLTLDAEGWATNKDVIRALRAEGLPITTASLKEIVAEDPEKFYTLDGELIRLNIAPLVPPQVLFHCIPRDAIGIVVSKGLIPIRHQHVHLFTDLATAETAEGEYGALIGFAVRSFAMAGAGHTFYRNKKLIWMTEMVRPQYLTVVSL